MKIYLWFTANFLVFNGRNNEWPRISIRHKLTSLPHIVLLAAPLFVPAFRSSILGNDICNICVRSNTYIVNKGASFDVTLKIAILKCFYDHLSVLYHIWHWSSFFRNFYHSLKQLEKCLCSSVAVENIQLYLRNFQLKLRLASDYATLTHFLSYRA